MALPSCKHCPEWSKNYKYKCDYRCVKRSKEPIVIDWDKRITMKQLTDAFMGNLGLKISERTISVLGREIEKLL